MQANSKDSIGKAEQGNEGNNCDGASNCFCPLRCTLSSPNWVLVFMASVNYTSSCHQDAMALFWTVSHVMNSAEGTDGKQYHECPIVNQEGKILTTYTSSQTSTVKLVKPNLPTFHETTCICTSNFLWTKSWGGSK